MIGHKKISPVFWWISCSQFVKYAKLVVFQKIKTVELSYFGISKYNSTMNLIHSLVFLLFYFVKENWLDEKSVLHRYTNARIKILFCIICPRGFFVKLAYCRLFYSNRLIFISVFFIQLEVFILNVFYLYKNTSLLYIPSLIYTNILLIIYNTI